ncbi:ABC transporter ATP-binding protein [symbiont of Argiope bruennichi]|uniref:ABC transporter ATP-binding protein n=1 Tax=symbiont of Argiope bruennichi TaxID=2810479 RepID=UPI003DA33E9C
MKINKKPFKNLKNKINSSLKALRDKPDNKFFSDEVLEEKILNSKHSLRVNNVTKIFNNFVAVKNASFTVSKGVIHGFLGPNGSGKTTIIKSIITAINLSFGTIDLFGVDHSSVNAKKTIGYIPESARFPKNTSCYEYLVVMGVLSGKKVEEAKKIATDILKQLDLLKFKKKSPLNFSSGMQKKILLAQALINDPKFLILDEPAENLDPSTRKFLYDELVKLKEQGKTIFISSHVLAELNDIVDEITIIKYGEILFTGPVNSVIGIETNAYSLFTSDINKTIKLLQNKNYLFHVEEEEIIVKILNEHQKYILQEQLLKNNIVIEKFVHYRKNLQFFYNEVLEKKDFR